MNTRWLARVPDPGSTVRSPEVLHRALTPRARRAVTSAVLALATFVGAVIAVAAGPGEAGATTRATAGHINRAFQFRNGSIRLTGWAFDRDHPRRHPGVCVVIHRRCVRTIHPHAASPKLDRSRHIGGAHRFSIIMRQPRRPGVRIGLQTTVTRHRLFHTWALSPGKRVVRVARRHVGERYRYGGTSPRTGFDCSGYTMFSYRHGRTAALPHNAEAQRRARGMRSIRRSHARPGDLVFYMSGGSAYHVAVYAGHGYQYSATDPQQGVRYQPISSRNVTFGTDWHR
jgi:hypothetical protein